MGVPRLDPARVPAVVLGSSITALGVVRGLGRAGVRPITMCDPGSMPARSRFARDRAVHARETGDGGELLAALDRLALGRAVLIPCSDVWSAAVCELPSDARERYPASIASCEVIETFVDKWRFAQALQRLDVPRPRTELVAGEDDLRSRATGGSFLKPRLSQQFSRRFQRKAFSFEDAEGAAAAYRMLAAAGHEAVLQEYVPGPPDGHLFVDGFVDAGGEVRAVFVRRRLRMYPVDFGNSSFMVSISPAAVPQPIDDLVRLLHGVGYRGVFNAEFKRDARDGVYRLLEVNSRPWWYIEFAARCGVDVTVMAYRDALGLPVATVDTYREGRRCVYLWQDVRAVAHARRHGGYPLWRCARDWVGATPAVFAWDDPAPTVAMSWAHVRSLPSRRAAVVPA